MAEVFGWIVSNWSVIVGALGALLLAASAVTRLTPSPKDDAFVAKLLGWFSVLEHMDVGGAKAPLTRPKPAPSPADEPLISAPADTRQPNGADRPERPSRAR